MKYKIIEKDIYYIELETDNEHDALLEVVKKDRLELKNKTFSNMITAVEKVGDFERPNCSIKIPINPTMEDWLKVAKKISMILRREGLDEQADRFIKDCADDIIYSNNLECEYGFDFLKKIADPYVKLKLLNQRQKT